MVYDWPFINSLNNIYYYLVWNNFYYFSNNEYYENENKKLIKNNNDILYIYKEELLNNKYLFKIRKVDINKKFNYINFFINKDKKDKNNFYFFTLKGEIHKYKFKNNNSFILKQIITNEILSNLPIIKLCYYHDNNYLIITNQSNIFNFDLLNQTMTEICIKNKFNDILDNKGIQYKLKIFKYDEILNCIIYEQDEHIIVLSLDNFVIIKKFKIDYYNYNILTINNIPIII